MFTPLKRAFTAVAVLVAATLAALPAAADPALWVIRDEDSSIYLFGTVHVLKPETVWRTPAIDAALAEADELWIEVETDDPAAMGPLVRRHGLDPANPLSSKLTAEQKARLDAAAASMGASGAAFEPLRPWLAGLQLSIGPLVKAGYDPASGVESKLKAAARDAGKPIRTLETLEQQIGFFADLPPAVELAFLLSALDEMDSGPAMLDALVAAWSAGDVAALDDLMVREMAADYPELYEALLVRRNRDWAGQIQTLLAGEGVSVIAVGAAHLVGDDSVQALLGARGIAVERLLD
ncbi:MAG: TraB/GumN family protein [Caulobacter sp.]|nr:TraB/GumN family protein [Caulobacter sp.]